MNGRRRLMMGLALLGGLGSARVSGMDFTVNSAVDAHDAALDGVCETAAGNGICTLRAAVEELDVAIVTQRRVFLPALTFVISLGQLNFSSAMLLQGGGMDATIVRAEVGSPDRFMSDHGNNGDLTLRDLTITGFDNGSDFGDLGGAVSSLGYLVVERCRLEHNQSGQGGAIYSGGDVTILDSILSFNRSNEGGAVFSQGSLHVERSIFESNNAKYSGGAIFMDAGNGKNVIHASLFLANVAGYGGALHFRRSGAVVNSTFHANRATTEGGAIWAWASDPVRIINSTLTANVANSDLDGFGTGGGIFVYGADVVELSNSILAGNLEYEYYFACECWIGFPRECAGSIASNGFNIIQTNPGGCVVTGPVQAVDPLLLPLAYYGGPTRSRELGPGSPARNAGTPLAQGGCVDSLGAPVTTDQRGAVRPYGGECDLGAVEHGTMMFRDGFDTAVRWSAITD